MAPFERPSLMCVGSRVRLPSSWRSWMPYATGRTSRIAMSPYFEMTSRATSARERDGRTGMDADSMELFGAGGGGPGGPPLSARVSGLVGLHPLVEHHLPPFGGVSAVVAQRGVAVGVDVIHAQRALTAL